MAWAVQIADLLSRLVDLFIHLDLHLDQWATLLGPWLYGLLFLIIFCETGLVITPYLPGDSLLFAVGALSTREGFPVKIRWALPLLAFAAILGDAVNYAIGRRIGPKIFSRQESRFLNREHLERAHRFYESHGGKTIILARFIPIIRTFAPFVAGMGSMSYPRFAVFNVVGGLLWTSGFLLAGYRFAEFPVVKKHFHLVILAIIILSALPAVVEYWKAARHSQKSH